MRPSRIARSRTMPGAAGAVDDETATDQGAAIGTAPRRCGGSACPRRPERGGRQPFAERASGCRARWSRRGGSRPRASRGRARSGRSPRRACSGRRSSRTRSFGPAPHSGGGRRRQWPDSCARRGVIEDVVDPVGQHVDPTHPAFGHRDLQVGEPGAHARPEPVGRGEEGVDREQRREQLERRVVARATAPRTTNRCEGTRPYGFVTGRQERIPVTRVERRKPELGRELGEAQAPGSRARRWLAPWRPRRPGRGAT